MLVARPVAVFLCLAPFQLSLERKAVHLLGRPARSGRHFSRLDPAAGRVAGCLLYFDVGFVVVLSSLLVQGWTVALAARKLDISFTAQRPLPRRVELDLPGQLARRDYRLSGRLRTAPYLRRGLMPNWARPTLVIRNEEILTPDGGASGARRRLRLSPGAAGKAQALDRFFVRHAAADCA